MTTPLPHYTGNKKIPGLFETIFNNIPPITQFWELFAGSAVLSYAMPQSVRIVLCDKDNSVTLAHAKLGQNNFTVITGNYADLLNANSAVLESSASDILVYLDPPYLLSSRSRGSELYKHEFAEPDHVKMLQLASTIKCYCMISHPACELYDAHLRGWRRVDQEVCYNGRVTLESIYMNYAVPDQLLTYRYLGVDCWDRQRLKRMKDNMLRKLSTGDSQVRHMLLAAIEEKFFRK